MGPKILIVDDNDDLRTMLAAILGSRFTVLAASAGAEALELVKKERPALMLLDIAMPGMSGLEVLEAVRALDPALTVVMLTSLHDIDVAARALELGAAEYVTKPFDANYIRAEVQRLVEKQGGPGEGKPWRAAS